MPDMRFEINEQTMPVVKQIGSHMPGGFFIYKAEGDEELLYANQAVIDIFGCDDLEDFKRLTGFTFRGMLHPEDYAAVSDSIVEQIESSDDLMDYVEYRVIRKDGAVRWVDDYGHYTETETYGGLYYVFISDITEKKARAEEEKRRLIEEMESAAKLAQMMGSVASLLTNMPAMSFSKDAETGRYLACNQAFAEYAHKDDPMGVVGLTDYEIFDPVTAKHFTLDDKKALSMDEPYIFFEDVPDAVGVPRSFQTTKLKFTDGAGKLCTLGMCVDVTEMTRIKSAEAAARVKQEELERQLALQEKLLGEERRRTQQEKLITALSSDYRGVYYIELDKDEGICYQIHSELDHGFRVGEHFSFLKDITHYAEMFVTEEYREEFLRFIQPEMIRSGLLSERVISFRYMVRQNGKDTYEMIRFAGVRHPEDRDDHYVHAVSMCFMDVDLEMRRTLEQSTLLRDALSRAEDASKAKTAFLSNMSHEIRTPITGILGMNEMIRRETINADVLAYSENIRNAGVSLLGIVNDILDFSKIESGKMELIEVDNDLPLLDRHVINLMRLRAEEKGLSFRVELDEALPRRMRGDEIRIKQILTNLLSNAVKYTERGDVRMEFQLLSAENGFAQLRISISDTGIGIRPEDIDKLFTAFERLDQIRTRKILGTGLGLPISQKMLSLMGSELQVESEYGKGSTFSFTLRQKITDASPIGAFDLLAATDSARKLGRTPFYAPEARILVVDDTPMNIQVISGLLERTKMKIDTAESGAEGIECFGASDYDLVFMDYRMPVMDGIETLEKIKELYPEKAARTPIICLTASAVSGTREFMIGAGFTDYLSKPVNIEEMENTLMRYLPADKITLAAREDTTEDSLALLPAALFDISFLDPAQGLQFCGDAEGYTEALKTFERSIEHRAEELERCLASGDIEGYTLKIHSLKSTARAVGAVALSERAKELEQAGNNTDVETLRRETPSFLEEYRGMGGPLRRLFQSEPVKGEKPALSEAEFDDALATVRQLAANFDYDSILMVLDTLADAAVPKSREETYEKLCRAADRCDWEELGKLS